MSHFAVYECNVSNMDYVKRALVEMGLSYQEDVVITDYFNQKRRASLAVVSEEGKLLPVGWIKNEENGFDLQADWFKTRFSEKRFTNQIGQLHTKYQILDACEENRWDVDAEDIVTNENGEIEIYATQFA